jgi:uncharacterized protein
MKILRAADHKRMPWKNGRGETVEIAVFPPDATVDTFDWRVSMATVAEDGPFSVFPGIDRTLSLLEGRGMKLTIDGGDGILLTQACAPHAFPADARTTARLVDGAITDLNVMSRRGRFGHHVVKHAGPAVLESGAGILILLCHQGDLTLFTDEDRETLARLDCAMVTANERLELSGSGEGFLIRIAEQP